MHCTVPTKMENPDSTGTTLEKIKGNVRITVLLLTCPLFLSKTTKAYSPSHTYRNWFKPPIKANMIDWEMMIGREMQDSSV